MYLKLFLLVIISLTIFSSCGDKIAAVYDPTPYNLKLGQFPTPSLSLDNPLTVEGVKLGRMLFYEKALSKDITQACADCHRQTDGFSDFNQFSIGVENLPGKRQAMAIFNMAYHKNGFFWDGRASLLRDQSLLPIQDPLEMNETLENVISKLSNDEMYVNQFIRAFDSEEINSEKISFALEQFMMSIISNDSKYDKFLAGQVSLTESEERGLKLFQNEYNPFFPESSGADCMHCHGGINFDNNLYMNNGLDSEENIKDIGYEAVTLNKDDRGKFKVPSLRNIEMTAPYMHDGRFNTLEEVIEHYNSGIQESSTVDFALLNTKQTGLQLTEQDKIDLIAFLKTLTDQTYLNNEAYSSPF